VPFAQARKNNSESALNGRGGTSQEPVHLGGYTLNARRGPPKKIALYSRKAEYGGKALQNPRGMEF